MDVNAHSAPQPPPTQAQINIGDIMQIYVNLANVEPRKEQLNPILTKLETIINTFATSLTPGPTK